MMTIEQLQHAIGTAMDGQFGPNSRAALMQRFANRQAPAITAEQVAQMAADLGCTVRQLEKVAKVESAGGGFDAEGRPKILFERHLFHRLTDGRFSVSAFSNPTYGGYGESSWLKLGLACAKDPDAAFSACSWGKFQVLGMRWAALGYASPFELAISTTLSEAAHYELLARYIRAFDLEDALRAISDDPETCRAFARGYNGPQYRKFSYHLKLARA